MINVQGRITVTVKGRAVRVDAEGLDRGEVAWALGEALRAVHRDMNEGEIEARKKTSDILLVGAVDGLKRDGH